MRDLCAQGRLRIENFFARQPDLRLPGFVPSDFDAVAAALLALKNHPLLNGVTFVEWGSGFGIAAMLATQIGFAAFGIEIEAELTKAAEKLAEDQHLDTEFACGTFVPSTAQDDVNFGEGPEWLKDGGLDGYALLDVDPQDIDLFFAYPWPGESETLETLFDAIAGAGALLLTWNGIDGMRLFRRTSAAPCSF